MGLRQKKKDKDQKSTVLEVWMKTLGQEKAEEKGDKTWSFVELFCGPWITGWGEMVFKSAPWSVCVKQQISNNLTPWQPVFQGNYEL